jgi:hypothetical protein
MLFSCSVGYRANASELLFGQFLRQCVAACMMQLIVQGDDAPVIDGTEKERDGARVEASTPNHLSKSITPASITP